jgi:hypothetical protein
MLMLYVEIQLKKAALPASLYDDQSGRLEEDVRAKHGTVQIHR